MNLDYRSLVTMRFISQSIALTNSSYKYFLIDLRPNVDIAASEAGFLLSSQQLSTKKAIIQNLNYKYWHSFYDYFMPRDVTIILKSSRIHGTYRDTTANNYGYLFIFSNWLSLVFCLVCHTYFSLV